MLLNIYSQLQGISAFVHAVETGSFTAAAERMGVSKSATGKSIGRLEDRLGVRLLHRTTRRLSLTVEGEAYYKSCLKVMEELTAAESLLASRKRKVAGTLRVNLPISYGRLCVMPVLVETAKRNPELELDVSFADRRVDLVEEGYDLAIRIGHPGDQASLIGRRISTQRSVICASPSYVMARGTPTTVEDLRRHDCLGFARDGKPLDWTVAGRDGRAMNIELWPRHVVGHGEAIRDAALSGLGLARLPYWLAEDEIAAGALVVLPIAMPAEDAPIYAIWPRSRDLSPKVRVAVDALAEALGGQLAQEAGSEPSEMRQGRA